MANILFLRLEGPMQAWGERAHWELRDTATEPTKSGVVGLLGCALGLQADEDLMHLSQSISLGVRCDRPGIVLEDYHTVIGGVMSAEGKIKRNASTREPETVVSHRQYLCDASFLAAVQCDQAGVIEKLAGALLSPAWPPYLGRRSCPPSRVLFEGVGDYDTLLDALAAWPRSGSEAADTRSAPLRAVIECSAGEGVRRNDEVWLRSRRTFGPRYTRDVAVSPPMGKEEG
ncbi:MAG: type I-E CRISPR-associated protein Cas5/CasD [Anaerolineae bacterium]